VCFNSREAQQVVLDRLQAIILEVHRMFHRARALRVHVLS
jgi:hypothetical protein